jgi:hypothetical protein
VIYSLSRKRTQHNNPFTHLNPAFTQYRYFLLFYGFRFGQNSTTMKKILFTIAACSCLLGTAQHLGNFNNQAAEMSISRANIATADSGYISNAKRMAISSALQPSNVLNINLRSLYNIEATDYTAVFNINQVGATATETTQLMNDKINAVKAVLKSQGFQGKFATDMISFVPQYEIEVIKKLFSKTYTEVPVGFELQQNLLISYKNDADFEKILTACASNEIYNLVKVDYYVENLQAKYDELQKKILEEVAKKKEFYKALGYDMAAYDVRMADHKYYHMPKDFYKSYQASENISAQALKQQKGITEVRKPQSYYYDALSYDGYDVVINPAITKPVIQLGMDLSLLYVPKPEKPAAPIAPVETPKPKVYVISPQGPVDIKQLPNS